MLAPSMVPASACYSFDSVYLEYANLTSSGKFSDEPESDEYIFLCHGYNQCTN